MYRRGIGLLDPSNGVPLAEGTTYPMPLCLFRLGQVKPLHVRTLVRPVKSGIAFGMSSAEGAVSETYAVTRGNDATSVRPEGNVASLRQVLEALGTALANAANDDLGATFEQHVRQALQLRAVRLREVRARYQARLVTPTRTSDSIVLGVPTADPRIQAVFEASCQPDRPLAEPDYDLLVALAHVGGLVLEIGRGRTPSTSATLGAGPLIGSTDVMKALRAQIERVAATDFTVLIEVRSIASSECNVLTEREVFEVAEPSARRRSSAFLMNGGDRELDGQALKFGLGSVPACRITVRRRLLTGRAPIRNHCQPLLEWLLEGVPLASSALSSVSRSRIACSTVDARAPALDGGDEVFQFLLDSVILVRSTSSRSAGRLSITAFNADATRSAM